MNILKLLVPAIIPVMLIMQGCSSKMSLGEQNARSFAQPGPGNSAIYIYRVSHFVGSAAETNIVFDKKKIVELENGSFIYIPTVPGSHTMVSTQSSWIHSLVAGEDYKSNAFRIKTEDNTNYFVEFVYLDGKFVLKDFEEASKEIKECDYLPLIN